MREEELAVVHYDIYPSKLIILANNYIEKCITASGVIYIASGSLMTSIEQSKDIRLNIKYSLIMTILGQNSLVLKI